eukprot:RCo023312
MLRPVRLIHRCLRVLNPTPCRWESHTKCSQPVDLQSAINEWEMTGSLFSLRELGNRLLQKHYVKGEYEEVKKYFQILFEWRLVDRASYTWLFASLTKSEEIEFFYSKRYLTHSHAGGMAWSYDSIVVPKGIPDHVVKDLEECTKKHCVGRGRPEIRVKSMEVVLQHIGRHYVEKWR